MIWRYRLFGLFICLLLLLPSSVRLHAQSPKPTHGDAVIEQFLKNETARVSQRTFAGAKTLAEWEQRRSQLKQEYMEMLGLWPIPEKTPLHATVTGTVAGAGFVVEKIHFQSKPGLYVTGNLFRPQQVTKKLPTILYVCGHSGKGRDGNKTAFQDHGQWFAKHGYVCFIVDTLQLGELAGIHHGTYRYDRWWWQARGYTSAGIECWNGVRAIDYLLTRADVDADRIGVTGISGGGAATFWIAAADERVKCAVPVSGMSDLESYVSHKIVNGHCDCMFMINTFAWEWTTIAALVAPRPLLFANSDNDPIFPMDGNRRIIQRLRQLYQLYGKPDLVDDYVSKGGHAYRPDLRLAIFQFLEKHLCQRSGKLDDVSEKLIPDRELRVFPEDKDIPKDVLNQQIDETFVPLVTDKLPTADTFAKWKKEKVTELRRLSFRSFPERIPVAKWKTKLSEQQETLTTEADTIEVRLTTLQAGNKNKTGTLIVLGPDDTLPTAIPEWAKAHVGEGAVVVLQPRGVGPTAWTRKSPPNYVERAHALLGRTVDEGRVWDVAAVLRYVRQQRMGTAWRIVGKGTAGVIGAYAALVEPDLAEIVTVIEPPTSHRQGPIFLNVLRTMDVATSLGLLAPTPLVLSNTTKEMHQRVTDVYRIASAEKKLQK